MGPGIRRVLFIGPLGPCPGPHRPGRVQLGSRMTSARVTLCGRQDELVSVSEGIGWSFAPPRPGTSVAAVGHALFDPSVECTPAGPSVSRGTLAKGVQPAFDAGLFVGIFTRARQSAEYAAANLSCCKVRRWSIEGTRVACFSTWMPVGPSVRHPHVTLT